MSERKGMALFAALLMIGLTTCANMAKGEIPTAEFKDMLQSRILEVLDEWPVEDQYAVMFFIYPNEEYEYRGYSNIPEFKMLYKNESEMEHNVNPFFRASGDDEERWNPAFWSYDRQWPVIEFEKPNPMADALIDWYESTGVQDIGGESGGVFDENMRYIGTGPNGLPELLKLVTEITKELQTDGVIEAKFGRKLPVILADFDCTWYMINATAEANPNGEAEAYIQACLRHGDISEDQLVRNN